MHQLIYQLFLGRTPDAQLPDHEGVILRKLGEYEWSTLVALGFSEVYLLGLLDSRGPVIVDGEEGIDLKHSGFERTASVFAIRDHRSVNPRLGTMDDFIYLSGKIRAAGLKVLVDFVPNHTGLDHPWLRTNPEYYVQDNDFALRAFSGDVAVLNYDNKQLCDEMIRTLFTLAKMGVDGVRVDMAHLIPTFFWQQALSEVKKQYPEFIFMAEAYSDSVYNWGPLEDLLNAGFDRIYHEFWYRNVALWAQSQNYQPLFSHMEYLFNHSKDAHKLVTYLSNHDDSFFDELKQFTKGLQCIISALPGSTLVFNGFLNGRSKRLAHHCLELLEAKYFDLYTIPAWWHGWIEYKQHFDPTAESIRQASQGLWVFDLKTNQEERHHLYFNPTNNPHPLPNGLVHFTFEHTQDLLGPGDIVVLSA